MKPRLHPSASPSLDVIHHHDQIPQDPLVRLTIYIINSQAQPFFPLLGFHCDTSGVNPEVLGNIFPADCESVLPQCMLNPTSLVSPVEFLHRAWP